MNATVCPPLKTVNTHEGENMINAFNTLIAPTHNKLIQLLNPDDDYTVIPVKVRHASGTTQTIENGIVTECDHYGADMGDVELNGLHYDSESGQVEEIDGARRALVCDKCKAWKIPQGSEWYE